MNKLTDFVKGLLAGVFCSAVIFVFISAVHLQNERDRGIVEYAERQEIIDGLREDYAGRDPVEFLELPGVWGAVDGASADFIRKRDEALQRFRSRLAD
jgi:hypothetical protein